MSISGRRIKQAVSVIGTSVGLALSLTLAAPGTAAAAETAASPARFANYEYKQCIAENHYYNLWALPCDKAYSEQYWRWTGTTNTSSTLQNYVWDHCLDSNKERHVYIGDCNGGNNQLWQVIQPAPASAVMLRNTATRLCLYQTTGGLYRTATCDRNDRTQRWTIG
ncbi:RICIN domain-containing protein [Streptomyces sp. NPDC018029]|uniref:RICIN domain-containing protein n=1 Tax=Streptomyces sp. NPDC018029 TaxID=3365032 RepID=UPI0037B99CB9